MSVRAVDERGFDKMMRCMTTGICSGYGESGGKRKAVFLAPATFCLCCSLACQNGTFLPRPSCRHD